MSASVFDHPWLGGLFADPALAACLDADTQLTHMLAVEAAYARALGQTGMVPADIAETAATAITAARPGMDALRDGMDRDGVVVPALVRALKAAVPEAAHSALHRGLTSQDVMDTATILSARAVNDILADRLTLLIEALDALDARFGTAPLMGRTRMQAALPIAVADRLDTWRRPLIGHLDALPALRARLERVQFGGAVGTRDAAGDQADTLGRALAAELGLAPADTAWHSTRETVVEYGDWLSRVTGSLGKFGQDIALMALQGIDEVALAGGGGSSAMPHKQNPVAAELLVTLARFNATQIGGLHHAMIHEQERSGAAWSLEWMLLPQMQLATGRALSLAQTLCGNITRLGGAPD